MSVNYIFPAKTSKQFTRCYLKKRNQTEAIFTKDQPLKDQNSLNQIFYTYIKNMLSYSPVKLKGTANIIFYTNECVNMNRFMFTNSKRPIYDDNQNDYTYLVTENEKFCTINLLRKNLGCFIPFY